MKYHRNYKIVSFHTPDYREHAEGLIASIEEKLPGVEYEIDAISGMSWESATCLKGHFVWDKLRKSNKPVVWIDADAVVESDLKFPSVDFAIYARFADGVRHTWSPFRTGTVYFGKSEDASILARAWADACRARTDGIDQWALFKAWLGQQVDQVYPSTVWLPLAYCQKINESDEPALITHSMASRTLRRKK